MDYKQDFSNTNNHECNVLHHDATHHIAKGKRTKRLRLLCGPGAVMTAASSCSSASGDHGSSGDDHGSFSISSTTNQEEEDMANCLILLAQGGGDSHHGCGNNKKIEIKSRKFSEIETAAINNNNNKVGFYIYECKTCNRTFPSFQALGGHRASHKKPKLTTIPAEEKKPPPPAPPSPPPPPPPPPPQQLMMKTNYDHHHHHSQQTESVPPNNNNPIISLQFGSGQKGNFHGNNNNKASKIHECSICGSEFASGQALGGHMRRHRATAAAAANNTTAQANVGLSRIEATVEVQPRNILELDLNLPAPEEDLREPKFQFAAATTKKSMVLSAAPALVDCHY